MVAFGQQATQMVGALYMLPPATLAGSVGIMGLSVSVGLLIASLGIIIPLATAIGAAFMRMKKDSDGAGKSASSLDEKLKSLKTTLQDYADTLTAMRAGVSLDELFATRGIDAAEKSLADAKAVLGALETSFNLTTSAGDGYLNMADDIAKLWGGDAASKYAAALQVVTDAEKLLADLHTKEADTRAKNFADSLRSITQETTLLQIQAKFGEDSAEAINEALAQETLNRKAAIDQRVIAGDLDATAAATLKQQIDLQADLGAQIKADAAAKVDAEARSADLQEKINIFLSAQQRIRNENGARMQEQLDLERDIHQFAMSQTFEKRQQRSAAMELLKNAIEVHNKEKAIREEIGDAAAEALKLAGVDITTGVDAAAKAAAVLAANLGVSLLAAQNMVNLQGTKTYGGRGSGTEWRGTGDYQNELGYKDVDTLIEELTPKTKTKKTGGGKSPQEELAEFLTKKKEEADLQSQLVGLFGEERDLQSELIKFKQDYGKVASEAQTAEYTATLKQMAADKERQKVLEEANAQQQSIADTLQSSMSDAFMSMVDGTKSFKEAMKDMARTVIKQLYDILVVQQLVGSWNATSKTGSGLAGMIMGAFQAEGGAWSNGSQVKAYANGGVVGGPTTFPMAGGKTGLMGEAGPEAIMPLKRGANGKLGVQMEGGGGDTIVVNQSFNFQANGDATIKQLIAQAAPKIAQMTKSSLLDDRRRGGSTKAAFG